VQKAEGDAESTTNFFEMKLAWIERLHGQWGARKLSDEALVIGNATWEGEQERFTYFRVATDSDLTIECRYCPDGPCQTGAELLGSFVLNACTGQIFVSSSDMNEVSLVGPAGAWVARMRFELLAGGTFFASSEEGTPFVISRADANKFGLITGTPEDIEVLSKVSGREFGSYLYPHQYGEFASQHGVFLDDDERTFHVMPEQVLELDRYFDEESKDELDPGNVGITFSQHDLFRPDHDWPEFEADLPWDSGPRDQELPLPTRQGKNLKSSKPGLSFEEAGDIWDSLARQQLQFSQNQLNEATSLTDPLTLPTTTKYRFSLFYHPYVCDFLMELRRLGVPGLLDPNPDGPVGAADLVRQKKNRGFFVETYQPTSSVLNTPIQDIDFEFGGPYADYNWEIFFHAPFLIANRLSQNQRFEEARNWYHFMFDPTNRSNDKDPLRFWKIKPFYREADAPINEFLELASSSQGSAEAEEARQQYDEQVDAWLKNPFDPHAIARFRTTAYQKAVVMKYLDNLMAWADQLFRQDTIESINEATQLYVLALDLLGERPDALPPRSMPVVKTFEEVRGDLEGAALNNPLVHLENVIFSPVNPSRSLSGTRPLPLDLNNLLFNVSLQDTSFYFCIPPNDKLLGYWDTVEDRLFKIRHCMNIKGVVRQLPLFEPPIDPAMLVRARAAGVDLASALADLNAPLPHYRFGVMIQKAYALNQSVRGLGGALLSALEKKDAEELARLRSNQEVSVLEAIRQVKKLAVDEARHSLAAAEASLEVIHQRRDYYQNLIGGGWLPQEKANVALQAVAGSMQLSGSIMSSIAASVSPVPGVYIGAAGFSGSPLSFSQVVDGSKLAAVFSHMGQALTVGSAAASTAASILNVTSAFTRRADEWQNQLESAQKETKQVEKQIEAAAVRVAMAERDQENQERQIEQAREVREFMVNKFTNTELYQWMVGQMSSLYFQSYQLAYDLAKQTERAYRHELAQPQATFINFGYWDSLKKGLLAGERLQYDLERMDKSYLENNRREYEITKHVSLSLLDPVALLKLQTEGQCEFSIPEALYDLEYAGHYLRRIKSIGVSIPCVTGPYTCVPARLTLVSSRTRIDPNTSGDYAFDSGQEDRRFQVQTGAVQSIIVSAGREDSGLFVTDHRDERYLPFEGTGAISDWNLTLTSALPTFDWSTITDVVLHIRYTAREGGNLLRDAALSSLATVLSGIPLRRAFSALHEFPTEWNAFLRPAQSVSEAVLRLDLSEKRFPYFARNTGLKISEIQLVAIVKDPSNWSNTEVQVISGTSQDSVTLVSTDGLYAGNPSGTLAYQGAAPGLWTVTVPTTALGAPSEWIDDLVVLATYEITVGG
jgi:hypothetical protein